MKNSSFTINILKKTKFNLLNSLKLKKCLILKNASFIQEIHKLIYLDSFLNFSNPNFLKKNFYNKNMDTKDLIFFLNHLKKLVSQKKLCFPIYNFLKQHNLPKPIYLDSGSFRIWIDKKSFCTEIPKKFFEYSDTSLIDPIIQTNPTIPHGDYDRDRYNYMFNIWIPLTKLEKNESLIFFPRASRYYNKWINSFVKKKKSTYSEYHQKILSEISDKKYNDWGLGNFFQKKIKLGDALIFDSQIIHSSPIKKKICRFSLEIRVSVNCYDNNSSYKLTFCNYKNFKNLEKFENITHFFKKTEDFSKAIEYNYPIHKYKLNSRKKQIRLDNLEEDSFFVLLKICIKTNNIILVKKCYDYINKNFKKKLFSKFWALNYIRVFCHFNLFEESINFLNSLKTYEPFKYKINPHNRYNGYIDKPLSLNNKELNFIISLYLKIIRSNSINLLKNNSDFFDLRLFTTRRFIHIKNGKFFSIIQSDNLFILINNKLINNLISLKNLDKLFKVNNKDLFVNERYEKIYFIFKKKEKKNNMIIIILNFLKKLLIILKK